MNFNFLEEWWLIGIFKKIFNGWINYNWNSYKRRIVQRPICRENFTTSLDAIIAGGAGRACIACRKRTIAFSTISFDSTDVATHQVDEQGFQKLWNWNLELQKMLTSKPQVPTVRFFQHEGSNVAILKSCHFSAQVLKIFGF